MPRTKRVPTSVTGAFARRLDALMLDSGDTLKDIWEATGVAQTSICAWRKDKQTADINGLSSIAQYFGVSTDYLLGLSNNATPGLAPNDAEREAFEMKELARAKSNYVYRELSNAFRNVTVREWLGHGESVEFKVSESGECVGVKTIRFAEAPGIYVEAETSPGSGKIVAQYGNYIGCVKLPEEIRTELVFTAQQLRRKG